MFIQKLKKNTFKRLPKNAEPWCFKGFALVCFPVVLKKKVNFILNSVLPVKCITILLKYCYYSLIKQYICAFFIVRFING